jgi:hypothetical protein
MKPPQEIYETIPPNPDYTKEFMNLPGVYCQGCGSTFALYSFSFIPPNGLDENGKPFYHSCFKCEKTTRPNP